jgi:hypothetical protein
MNIVIALSFFSIIMVLIFLPSLAVWLIVIRQAFGRSAWFQLPLALAGPLIAVFFFSVMVWLPAYSGRCGGWLGETYPCGFGQYAIETLYWAAMSMAIPASTGVLLGVIVLAIGLIRRNKSR